MDPQPDDLTAPDDLTLLRSARAGDRLAFGVLYLRHHAAAWRMACVACRFSPDAELAVIEGFTRVFSALPEKSEEFDAGPVTFRPYLLACVRQAALDRARAAGRAGRDDEPAPLAGLAPDGEVVLSSLEHHVARGALAALPERARTALWLSDVEAMTPGEIVAILGGSPDEIAGLTAAARAEVQAGQAATLGGHEVRADCRFTVEHLEDYDSAKLDPAEGVLVRSHLDSCPPCRMRFDELTNAPAALAAAVPAAPLLGGETQQHWLSSAATIHPAERLLPPGLAAATPVRRLPDVLRLPGRSGRTGGRAGRSAPRPRSPQPGPVDLTVPADPVVAAGWTGWTGWPGWSGSPTPSLPPAWTIPPGRATAPRRPRRRRRERRSALAAGLPSLVRRGRDIVWPAVPAVGLVVAWLAVMLAIPRLMQPATAPGPSGMALPAVQAYVPGYLPGAAPIAPHKASAALESIAAAPAAPAAPTAATDDGGPAPTELVLDFVASSGRSTAASTGPGHAPEPAAASGPVRLIPVARTSPAVVPPVQPPVAPVSIAVTPAAAPEPSEPAAAPAKKSKPGKGDRPQKPGKADGKHSVPRSKIVSA